MAVLQQQESKRLGETVEAVAQFVRLMHAHERGRSGDESEAREALARLGVKVQLRKQVRDAR